MILFTFSGNTLVFLSAEQALKSALAVDRDVDLDTLTTVDVLVAAVLLFVHDHSYQYAACKFVQQVSLLQSHAATLFI